MSTLDYTTLVAMSCTCRNSSSMFSSTISVLVALLTNNPNKISEAYSAIAEDKKRIVEAKVSAIQRYFRNPRYIGLEHPTRIWGVIVNSIKVAGNSPNVTKEQIELFTFPDKEVVQYFQDLICDRGMCEVVNKACNQPSSDIRILGAVVMASELNLELLKAIVAFFGEEGPTSLSAIPDDVLRAIDPHRLGMSD